MMKCDEFKTFGGIDTYVSDRRKDRKKIITPDGEDEFQIRYNRDENVGIVTGRSNKSYLILDSIDFWYDVIQEKYPAKQKCNCKNEYFKLTFNYIPRIGTDDYRAVEIISCCTACGKQKKLSEVDIDYSPTSQLFENPITYCEQPKIKYKTYSFGGYWKEDAFKDLIDFLSQKELWIYCWYWNHTEELRKCIFEINAKKYLDMGIYSSMDLALCMEVDTGAVVCVDYDCDKVDVIADSLEELLNKLTPMR